MKTHAYHVRIKTIALFLPKMNGSSFAPATEHRSDAGCATPCNGESAVSGELYFMAAFPYLDPYDCGRFWKDSRIWSPE